MIIFKNVTSLLTSNKEKQVLCILPKTKKSEIYSSFQSPIAKN